MIIYQNGNNFMGHKLPITTPQVVEVEASRPRNARGAGLIKKQAFKAGMKLRYKVHTSAQVRAAVWCFPGSG